MVKLLFCGDVDNNWEILINRLNELQRSNHGPFDAVFITGKNTSHPESDLALPMKGFAFDKSFIGISVNNLEVAQNGVGLINVLHNLSVGYMMENINDTNPEYEKIKKASTNPGYRGCDVLITADWPREMHHFLEESELNDFKGLGIGIGSGSKAASSIAMTLKPRYHFVAGLNCFYQRSPYRNAANAEGQPSASTRLICLDKVSTSKDKTKKWMHALSFSPIVNMSAAELAEQPAGTTDCPYVTVGEKLPAKLSYSGVNAPPPPKRAKTEVDASLTGASGAAGTFFFGNMGVPDKAGSASLSLEAPNSTITTLFIGGLARDMGDYELKSALPNATLVKRPPGKAFAFVEFSSHLAAKKVVETAARQGLVVRGRTLTVGWGKDKSSDTNRAGGDDGGHYGPGDGGNSGAIYERQLVPPTSDSKTLFVGGLPSIPTQAEVDASQFVAQQTAAETVSGEVPETLESALLALFPGSVLVSKVPGKSYAFVEFESYEAAMALVTKSISESTSLHGRALTIGWAKGDLINSALNRQQARAIVTAAPSEDSKVLFVGNVPQAASEKDIAGVFSNQGKIVAVKRPAGREYAFVEFASPGDAQDGINSATSSGDSPTLFDVKLLVGWAKGRAADKSCQSADCWFCLASPVVKVHLVVSVGDHAYLALPRGGVADSHVLVSPIDCVPSRVHLSAAAKKEFSRYQAAIEQLHSKQGLTAVRFERALRTKGSRDHMQMHVVPLANRLVARALTVFTNKAADMQLKFFEITDGRSIDEVVVSMEGGPYQEYFYIELPVAPASETEPARHKRFVYVNEEASSSAYQRFPMQFGSEVVAEILGEPEKAHWKNCLLAEEQEVQLADQFRDAFAPFDFTL